VYSVRDGAGELRELSCWRTGADAERKRAEDRRPFAGEKDDMITKFDSLYAGHVDMDDIGYGGAAVNSRVFSNEHLVGTFAKARNLARLLDRCGYDTFWLAEHISSAKGTNASPTCC